MISAARVESVPQPCLPPMKTTPTVWDPVRYARHCASASCLPTGQFQPGLKPPLLIPGLCFTTRPVIRWYESITSFATESPNEKTSRSSWTLILIPASRYSVDLRAEKKVSTSSRLARDRHRRAPRRASHYQLTTE